MGLVERIAAGAPVRQPRFDRIVSEQLTPQERAALVAAAKNPEWSDAALARVLQDEGFVVGAGTIAVWRASVKNETGAPLEPPAPEPAPAPLDSAPVDPVEPVPPV